MVAFLAGDGGSYLAATTIFADGGIMQRSPGTVEMSHGPLRRHHHRHRSRRRDPRPHPRRRPVSGSCCSSAATSSRARWRTGARTRSSSTGGTSRPTPGTTPTARRSSRRCTTSSAARPSSTARPSTGCGRRTSARSPTSTGSRRRGPSATTTSSPSTRRRSGSIRCAATTARTRPRARSKRYPWPAVSHEPRIAADTRRLAAGYHPFPAPCGVLLDEAQRHGSHCIRCCMCDGYPCLVHAKADAEVIAVRPALDHQNVTLLVDAEVVKLETDAGGRASPGSWCDREASDEPYEADIVVVSRPAPPTAPSSCCTRRTSTTRPGSPTARTRSAGTTCSTTARRSSRWARTRTHGVPEDPRHQRLLPRRRRTGMAARQHPDGRQVQRRGDEGRGAEADPARSRTGPCRTSPITPSTSG